VGHINGHEEDDAPANLFWTCRSGKVLFGNTLRDAGIGLPYALDPRMGRKIRAIGSIPQTIRFDTTPARFNLMSFPLRGNVQMATDITH
jgi:hypothetical protein